MTDSVLETEDSLPETVSVFSTSSDYLSDVVEQNDDLPIDANFNQFLLLEFLDFDFRPGSFKEYSAGIEAYSHPDYYVLLPMTKQEISHLIRNTAFENEENMGSKLDITRAIWEANREIRVGEKFDLGEPSDWTKSDCEVCLKKRAMKERNCCGFKICNECTSRYVAGKFETSPDNKIIECPNCDKYMTYTEVRLRLRFSTFTEATNRYYQKLRELSLKSDQYLCHNCGNILYSKSKYAVSISKPKMGLKLDCHNCHFSTCAHCKSPWHKNMSCKKYLKGEKSMLAWARGTEENPMATRCPGCKNWFQRTEGCDQMTCSCCRTSFYYQCGCRRHPKVPGAFPLGSHKSKFSVIGCKNLFLKKHPVLRKTIRGSLLASVVTLTVTLAVPVAILVGAVGGSFLIGYGGYKMGTIAKKTVSKKLALKTKSLNVFTTEMQY